MNLNLFGENLARDSVVVDDELDKLPDTLYIKPHLHRKVELGWGQIMELKMEEAI